MKGTEFIYVARQLLVAGDEASYRSAVSRAYYAAYNHGKEILKDLGFTVSKGPGGHGEVLRCLSNCGIPEIITAGSQLGDLHGKRINADYDMDRREFQKSDNARMQVNIAEGIIQNISKCENEQYRNIIIKKLREYWPLLKGLSP